MTARAERDADRRHVERLEREIAAVGARLQVGLIRFGGRFSYAV